MENKDELESQVEDIVERKLAERDGEVAAETDGSQAGSGEDGSETTFSRRSVLGTAGVAGLAGLLGASSATTSAAAASGSVGSPEAPVDLYADGIEASTIDVGQFAGDVDVGGHRLTNLSAPVDAADAAPKAYVDETNGGTGNPDVTYIDPGEQWVPLLEAADPGDVFWFRPGVHQDQTHDADDRGPTVISADDVVVHVANGAVLRARDGIDDPDADEDNEQFLRVTGDRVTFRGRGTIDGNGRNAPASEYPAHEHIIDLYDRDAADRDWIEGFRLDGLTLYDAPGGDGIYVNKASNVMLTNFRIDNAYRNGISFIDAEDAGVDNFLIENTSGRAPQSGIAFEQNTEGEVLDRLTISNGTTRNNVTHGLYVNNHFTDQNLGTSTVNVEISNVTTEGNGHRGFSLHGTSGAERIQIDQCAAVENASSGFYVGGDGKVRLQNCTVRNNGADGNTAHGSGVVAEFDEGNGTPADVWVNGLEAYDDAGNQKHPGIAMNGSTLRVVDARVGGHTFSQDGFRADGSGSVVEYDLVRVESGDAAAFTTNGGSRTDLDG